MVNGSQMDATSPAVPGFEVVQVKSWRDFSLVINSKIGEINANDFIFRGQSNSAHMLTASFDRRHPDLSPYRRTLAVHRIAALFLDLADRGEMRLKIKREEKDKTAMIGQHHGLATRMLDWSESRYVAAFFAYSGLTARYASSLEAEGANDHSEVSVYALDIQSEIISDDSLRIVKANGAKNERVRRQRGLFTVNQTDWLSIEDYVGHYCEKFALELSRTPLYRFDLPVQEARVALRDLQEMRISHDELFPGLDGVAREAMLREWLNDSA